ncbi:uncharacterized protein LOC144146334 [Haemaphysalis longicornis]
MCTPKSHTVDARKDPHCFPLAGCSTSSPSPGGRRGEWHCQQCSYATPCLGSLKRHQRIDTGERPFQCNTCGKAFVQKDHLDGHLRTHTGEKPFRCRFCPEAFTQHCQQKRHERKVHSHCTSYCKDSQCFASLPDAGPSASPSLGDGHRQQQGPPHGRRLLRCQQCSYVTSYQGQLNRHQRTHSGERPYQCSHCSRAFRQKSDLDIHVRIHTGERPFHCHLCPMDFTQRATLITHVRTHTGEKPYRCRFCPEAFTYHCQLKMHERKAHRHDQ